MYDFLFENPTVQVIGWVFGVLGWLIGVTSGMIQFKSYLEQKKMEDTYRTIFEQAQRDWAGRYTEEQVKELTKELTKLQSIIRRDIPRAAKHAFMLEQRQAISKDIGRLYSRYAQLSQTLSKPLELETVAPELQRAIESTILPDYLKQQQQQKNIFTLIVLLVIVTVIPFAMDFLYPVVSIFGFTMISTASLTAMLLTVLFGFLDKRIAPWFKNSGILPIATISICFLLIVLIIFYALFSYPSYRTYRNSFYWEENLTWFPGTVALLISVGIYGFSKISFSRAITIIGLIWFSIGLLLNLFPLQMFLWESRRELVIFGLPFHYIYTDKNEFIWWLRSLYTAFTELLRIGANLICWTIPIFIFWRFKKKYALHFHPSKIVFLPLWLVEWSLIAIWLGISLWISIGPWTRPFDLGRYGFPFQHTGITTLIYYFSDVVTISMLTANIVIWLTPILIYYVYRGFYRPPTESGHTTA